MSILKSIGPTSQFSTIGIYIIHKERNEIILLNFFTKKSVHVTDSEVHYSSFNSHLSVNNIALNFIWSNGAPPDKSSSIGYWERFSFSFRVFCFFFYFLLLELLLVIIFHSVIFN